MSKTQPLTRHLISINDLTNAEIETIFEVAQGFLKELADANVTYRIGRSTDLAAKSILATLFYEPSTRTRLSFESAMLRLGGANITSADPAVSSAAKGESLADTTRKTFAPDLTALTRAAGDKLKHLVIYRSASDALAAGFAPREGGRKARAV